MKRLYLLTFILLSTSVHSQEDPILKSQQNAISSMSLVDALASRIPGAKKITDRSGNKNIALRGRQSFNSAGDEVLWEIDGIIYLNPPELNASQVKYVEVKTGLAATNKYGSQGAGGVILVKTNVSSNEFNTARNLWNISAKKSIRNKNNKKKQKKKS
ncbi:MAG: TonB-dependent receptor plug domain-containing protein [Flavobacteriaceae bacterium]|nr:TonB-dependent receptor plug domain-containing protein [Flavobacteriaceae bacterium]